MTKEINNITVPGQKFSPARFKAYFHAYASANSRQLLMAAAAIVIVWLLVAILPQFMTDFSSYSVRKTVIENGINDPNMLMHDPYWNKELGCGAIMLMVFCTIAGCNMFSAMHGKGKRQDTLALPASMVEKYATYFVIYALGFFVVFYASFWLADALRVVTVETCSDYGEYAMLIPFNYIFSFDLISHFIYEGNPAVNAAPCIFFYSGALTLLGFFSLGSIIWQKSSFLKTICSLAVLVVVQLLMVYISLKMFFGFDSRLTERDFFELTGSVAQNVVFIICGLIIPVVLFWLGYRRFKDTDLVERW